MRLFFLFFLIVNIQYYVKAQNIAGGGGHSLIICSSGEIFSCGINDFEQTGILNVDTVSVYTRILTLDNIVQVSLGIRHSVVLKIDSTVWVWGGNDMGQLVDGSLINSPLPKKIDSLGHVMSVSGGWGHTLFLLKDSTVWGGGSNDFGALGTMTPPNIIYSPNKIPNLTNVKKVSAGDEFTLILKSDGTVWSFGLNAVGQLGIRNRVNSSIPVRVQELDNIIAINAGSGNSFAIKNDSSIWAWGSNIYGELGTGAPMSPTEYSDYPIQLQNLDSVVKISTISDHVIALQNNGKVWAWGRNNKGQLGDGTYIDRNIPVKINGLPPIIDIATTSWSSLAVDYQGNIYSWGTGPMLADSTTSHRPIPGLITPISCNPVISVEEEKVKKLKPEVFPNPTNGVVLINSGNKEIKSIEVFNSTGISLKKIYPENSGVDISDLPDGIYFLKLELDGGTVLRKVIKQ